MLIYALTGNDAYVISALWPTLACLIPSVCVFIQALLQKRRRWINVQYGIFLLGATLAFLLFGMVLVVGLLLIGIWALRPIFPHIITALSK